MPGEHAFRKRDCSRNAGGIFVDVKRIVEVRDAQAFQVQLRIEHDGGAKIGFEESVVFGFEHVERQGVAAFLDRVNDFLEFSEHRLAEKRSADVVDLGIDYVG